MRICETSTGFVYYVSVAGITGERTQAAAGAGRQRRLAPRADAAAHLHRLRHQPRRSTCKLLAPVADGLIVGSAIVRRIAAAADQPREQVLKDVGDYVATLLAALAAINHEDTKARIRAESRMTR